MHRPVSLIIAALSLTPLSAQTSANWNSSRGFGPDFPAGSPLLLSSDTLPAPRVSFPVSSGSGNFRITLFARNMHTNPMKRHHYISSEGKRMKAGPQGWKAELTGCGGKGIDITFSAEESPDYGLGTSPGFRFTAVDAESGKTLADEFVTGDFGHNSHPDRVVITRSGDRLRTQLANGSKHELPEISFSLTGIDSIAVSSLPGSATEFDGISFHQDSGVSARERYSDSRETVIRETEAASDPVCGFWAYFDSSMEENLLRLGGDYRLAILPDREDSRRYVMVYLDGAEKNASQWQPGMVKGYLMPTDFGDIYDVVWLDAEFKPLSHRLKATVENAFTVITIQFPYQSSQLRLRKSHRAHSY